MVTNINRQPAFLICVQHQLPVKTSDESGLLKCSVAKYVANLSADTMRLMFDTYRECMLNITFTL